MTSSTETPAPRMSADDEERILSMRIGGTTVREALEAAIAAGHVLRGPDGRLWLAGAGQMTTYVHKHAGSAANQCVFLIQFMYEHVYQKRTVPVGCAACYKVKVITNTLRQLMAAKAIAEQLPYNSKSGAEVENRQTQNFYGTYFFVSSLAEARILYNQVRPKIDADPSLGPAAKMIIKRGCTEYEWAHGPLDNYDFDPRQREIEAYLKARFGRETAGAPGSRKLAEAMRMLHMVQIAYQIGDETYKDFTGGKDLYPPIVTYDPQASAGPETSKN